MFTGIIEGLGTVREIRPDPRGAGKKLMIRAGFALDQTRIGDSIAINGACLTATTIQGTDFVVDVSDETLSTTTIGSLKSGDRVNMERALRLSSRLDGHLVSGHVDGVGKIERKRTLGNAIILSMRVPESFAGQMIPKGSIAVDGVSLTINACGQNSFEVSIIPHTAANTTLDFKDAGARVNIETDMIGKYVARFLSKGSGSRGETKIGLGMETLAKNGFL